MLKDLTSGRSEVGRSQAVAATCLPLAVPLFSACPKGSWERQCAQGRLVSDALLGVLGIWGSLRPTEHKSAHVSWGLAETTFPELLWALPGGFTHQ